MDPNRHEHHDEDFGAMDASMISSTSPYQPTTERVPDRRPFVAGFILDMQYVKSLSGVLKMIEIVLDIIVAICIGTIGLCSTSCSAASFLQFVCISAMIVTTGIFIIYAFGLQQKIAIINWPLTDFINCALFTLLYFIGSCFMAARAITDSGKAATAFGFLAFILYAMNSWRSYTVFRVDCMKRQSPVSHIEGVDENPETRDLA